METKNRIWDNDVCREINAMEANPEEYFFDHTEEYIKTLSDEEKYEIAYDRINDWLNDEVANLNINTTGRIILIGTIQRWNGGFSAYKLLSTTNIGEAMKDAIASFDGDNEFEIYVKDGGMYLAQTGHDNPTNPSIIEFRYLTCDFDDLANDRPDTLKENSLPVAPAVCTVFGWEVIAA